MTEETFTLDIEASGLDEPVVAEGSITKLEKLLLELAKHYYLKKTYRP